MKITIQPIQENKRILLVHITYELAGCFQKELCDLPLMMHSIPAAKYANLVIRHDHQIIQYQEKYIDEYPYYFSRIMIENEIQGHLSIEYDVYPRILDENSKCGPYLDFREEKGGINAGGESFLLRFKNLFGTVELSFLDTYGVCGYGENHVVKEGNINLFRDTYYAFGDIHQYQQDDFHFYYFKEPPFDLEPIASYSAKLFRIMKEYFQDSEDHYAIFLRKDPFNHSGGSALKRSYMLGYNDTEEFTLENQKNILAHELVHNYPHMLDEPYGIGTWYEEGIAEYYSIMLPLRNQLITLEEALDEIQRRSDAYYQNPFNQLDNLTIGSTCWEDKRRQTIPYGRGFFFLANLDVKIKKMTDSKMNLDDIVKEFIFKERANQPIDHESFFALLKKMTNLNEWDNYQFMASGKLFEPDPDSFDGHFNLVYNLQKAKFIWSIRQNS